MQACTVVNKGLDEITRLQDQLQNLQMQLRLTQAEAEKERTEKVALSDKLQAEKQRVPWELETLRSDLQKMQEQLDEEKLAGQTSSTESQKSQQELHGLQLTNAILAAALESEKKEREVEQAKSLQQFTALQQEMKKSGQGLMKYSCFLPLDEGGDPIHHQHCRTLTGLPSAAALVAFYDLLNLDGRCERLRFHYNPDASYVKPNARKMSPQDAFVYTLVLIKVGLDFGVAEVVTGIDSTTGGRYFVQWVRALKLFGEKMFPHPTREQVQACMPERWKDVYGTDFIRLIIDGVTWGVGVGAGVRVDVGVGIQLSIYRHYNHQYTTRYQSNHIFLINLCL
jgi:hypothetical protein